MIKQSLWSEKSVKLVNCRWKYLPVGETTQPAPAPRVEPRRAMTVIQEPPTTLSAPQPQPEPSQPRSFYGDDVSPLDVPIIPSLTQQIQDGGVLADIPKVAIHCLPAVRIEHVDKTYGQRYATLRTDFGNKFVFEAVMLEEQDLAIQFWTTCQQVTVGSILYPMNKDKRWWKVRDREPKTGGLLMTAVITDFNPSFGEPPQP